VQSRSALQTASTHDTQPPNPYSNPNPNPPRFYFLGDEDLLEVLGQARGAAVIQAHLRKLFSGIHRVGAAGGRVGAACRLACACPRRFIAGPLGKTICNSVQNSHKHTYV